ncbi:hypothetical protein ACM9HF_15675 [Colwellia sp. RE-S-Sl-9]
MNIQKIHLNTSFLSMYIENEQGLIFDHLKKSLYSISPVIVAFIFAIDENLSESEAIDDVSQYFNFSPTDLIFYYQEAKLFFSSSKFPLNYIDSRYPELTKLSGYSKFDDQKNAKSYTVGDSSFSITCENLSLFKIINSLLQPIEKKLDKVHFQIFIKKSVSDDKYFDVFCNELIIEERLLFQEVLPLIIDRMQILTFQQSDYCFCFHGAAIQTYEGVLLLPGVSGAGKSTLSAVLASKSNKIYSDELIVLDKHFNVNALKLPIAIKSGSWDVLSKYYPQLSEQPEFLRLDGRRLKYVWPNSFATNIKQNLKQKYLIFNPKFNSKSQASVSPEKLSIIDTITMLVEAGYQVGIELNEEKLESLLTFMERAYRYRHTYNTSAQAELEIKRLWERHYE